MGTVTFRCCTILFTSLCLLLTSGCHRQSKIPMDTVSFYRSGSPRNHTLLVFLPGRGDTVKSFDRNGFVAAVRAAGIATDMLGVEAYEEYYRDHTIFLRLREDVISPAIKMGYWEIWLVGISMGGIGALLYDTEYPGDLKGVIALAPYLGNVSILDEIAQAGGLAYWQPRPASGGDEEDRIIWSRLKLFAAPENSAGRIYLGYGRDDRFAETNRFFETILPAGQTVTISGGHDWQTWRRLWDALITGALRPWSDRK
jgi:pimeloyl-ACP methyl ester carboxylesterase